MTEVFDQILTPGTADHRFFGVSVGVVTSVEDPQGLGRVRIRLPWLADDALTSWARVAAPMAGPERGCYFPPDVEDEVLVAFEHGSPEFPYVLGSLWNGKDRPPAARDATSDVLVVKSRSGHVIKLTDTKGEEKIEITDHTGQNRVVIDSASSAVEITGGALTLRARSSLTLEADGQVTVKGSIVKIN